MSASLSVNLKQLPFQPKVIESHTESQASIDTVVVPSLPRQSINSSSSRADGIPKVSAATAFYLGRRQSTRDIVSSLPLVSADITSVAFALSTSMIASIAMGSESALGQPAFAAIALVMTLLCQHVHGLYPASGLSYSIEYRRILRTSLLVLVALSCGLLMQRSLYAFPILEFSVFATFYVVALSSGRSVLRHVLGPCNWWTQPVVLIGTPTETASLYQRLDTLRNEGLRPLGILYDPNSHWDRESDVNDTNTSYIGPISQLEEILLQTGTCRVAIADAANLQRFDWSRLHGIPHVMTSSDLGHHPTEKVRMVDRDGRLELHCHSTLTSPGSLWAKRFMDLALVLATAPFWIPLIGFIGLLIKICDPGPVFYRQNRVGRFRQPFRAIKFRSMVCNADQKLKAYLQAHPELHAEWQLTHKLRNDPRVTRIGEFLRKSSLDELPQLWNVLVGEMSLVGPRPIIDCTDYDREYIHDHPDVFDMYKMVRPGITGLWQVSGRNRTSYSKRVYFDRFYLSNWSLMLDVFILWRTIKTALFREGAC